MADADRPEPPSGRVELVAEQTDAGIRLDRFLAGRLSGFSRSRIQAMIKAGHVSGPGGTLEDAGAAVKPGTRLIVDVPEPEEAAPRPENIPLDVVFEDKHLIVIDKPAGLVVHPAAGHSSGTLVNALLAHCGDSLSGVGGVKRPGIVHRLDKDTSGLLVVAKTDQAHAGLSEQFAAHGTDGRMTRRYLALCWGAFEHRRGRIDLPLARSTTHRTKIAVAKGDAGRRAVTHYEVVEAFDDARGKPVASLVSCTLETGRTHQIRVHLAHTGHPLLGDATYGQHFAASTRRLSADARAALDAFGRQALHAAHLGFEHPATRRRMAFDSPLPADFDKIIQALRG